MRFRIEVEVCVEAESVQALDALAERIELAAAESAGTCSIQHPVDRWVSCLAVEGLDDESRGALERDGRQGLGLGIGQHEPSGACRLPGERPPPRPQ